ncbi:hypothetical protein LR48_Vigan05g037700 [Vigna angularis]|uniref:Uncharacterized protein n=1 Tax=Phaseolus angularis TaxID=3914 RepID=A0A0L9UJ25_PHAAN|nr:hypothetical protein LR48_Vigan05g037700 [Vigna angularis]
MPSAVQERSSQESGRSSRRQKSRRSSRVEARADTRPGAHGGRSSQIEDARPVRQALVQESGRSPRKRTLVRGRSSEDARPSQAEDARPARQRALVQVAERTLVQPDTRDARPCRRNERTLVHAEEDARPCRRTFVQQKWTLVQGGVNARQREVDVRPLSASREFHARA